MSRILPPDVAKKFRLWQSMAEAYTDIGKLPPVKRERMLKDCYDLLSAIESARKAA